MKTLPLKWIARAMALAVAVGTGCIDATTVYNIPDPGSGDDGGGMTDDGGGMTDDGGGGMATDGTGDGEGGMTTDGAPAE